jgi:hypothetical protein
MKFHFTNQLDAVLDEDRILLIDPNASLTRVMYLPHDGKKIYETYFQKNSLDTIEKISEMAQAIFTKEGEGLEPAKLEPAKEEGLKPGDSVESLPVTTFMVEIKDKNFLPVDLIEKILALIGRNSGKKLYSVQVRCHFDDLLKALKRLSSLPPQYKQDENVRVSFRLVVDRIDLSEEEAVRATDAVQHGHTFSILFNIPEEDPERTVMFVQSLFLKDLLVNFAITVRPNKEMHNVLETVRKHVEVFDEIGLDTLFAPDASDFADLSVDRMRSTLSGFYQAMDQLYDLEGLDTDRNIFLASIRGDVLCRPGGVTGTKNSPPVIYLNVRRTCGNDFDVYVPGGGALARNIPRRCASCSVCEVRNYCAGIWNPWYLQAEQSGRRDLMAVIEEQSCGFQKKMIRVFLGSLLAYFSELTPYKGSKSIIELFSGHVRIRPVGE